MAATKENQTGHDSGRVSQLLSADRADRASHREAEVFGRSREELNFWINSTGAALVVVRKKALVACSANRAAAVFFGVAQDDFDHCPLERLVGADAARMLGQIWSVAPPGSTGEPFVLRAVVCGQERLLLVHVSQMIVEGEALRLFTFTDAPPEGAVALAGWQENVVALLNWLPFGFEVSSRDDQIQFANSQFHDMFGYLQHDIENIEDWWRLAYPDPEYRRYARSLWDTSIAEARAENREMTPFDLEVATRDGSYRTVQFRHRSMGNFNVNLYLDVTRERAYAQELRILADTDPLTGAMNRRHFFTEAERLYALRSDPSSALGVLMLDIDHFKSINDLHGHGIGDLVLTEFTRRLRGTIRSGDLLARLGGEEFAILLDGIGKAGIRDLGERIRSEVSGLPFQVGGVDLAVTVSLGAAFRLAGEQSVEPAISRADRALYRAKEAGRDRVMLDGVYPPPA